MLILAAIVLISIHAPLAGCDQYREVIQRALDISIHAPLAGCDAEQQERKTAKAFQSTHPLRGATAQGRRTYTLVYEFQSTHPLRGATVQCTSCRLDDINFNPRTPCGVRQFAYICRTQDEKFQSTHPLRGATWLRKQRDAIQEISIHAPLAGCDYPTRRFRLAGRTFQSTHPLRGATARGVRWMMMY